ncbi:TPA: hypothetical protein N0F65_009546, partial [Lagenidium giganteum]
ANGEQCKLAPRKERCGKHPIINDQEIILKRCLTPVASEVVHTPTTSAVKPVEASNVELDEVPELDDSNVAPVIADSAVYNTEDDLDLELINSDEVIDYEAPEGAIGSFSDNIKAWSLLGEHIDHKCVDKVDSELIAQGYLTRIEIHNRRGERIKAKKRIYFKSEKTYLDVIKLKKSIVAMERLYTFIKGNIAYILQGGNGYYLTKNRDAFGEINYEVVKDIRNFDMGFSINNAIELDDDGLIEIDNTETETDIVGLRLMDVIGHYRDDITFGKIDFMPYNAKTGACDAKLSKFDWNSNEVFNKFNGFVHKYDPGFIVDQTKFKSFTTHIQEVWGSGREDILEYNMKLFAWYVQKPYQKTGACVVLEGEEGCGKNIIFEMLSRHVIGKRYCLETPKIKLLTGRFNKARENKI